MQGERGEAKLPYLNAGKDTGPFVLGLIRNPPGKHMLGMNTELTQEEFMKLWTSTLGVTGGVERSTIEDMTSSMPPVLAEELQDSLNFVREFGWTGGDKSVVMPKEVSRALATAAVFQKHVNLDDG